MVFLVVEPVRVLPPPIDLSGSYFVLFYTLMKKVFFPIGSGVEYSKFWDWDSSSRINFVWTHIHHRIFTFGHPLKAVLGLNC